MKSVIQLKANVLPGSRVEVSSPELPVGVKVDVIISYVKPDREKPRDVFEFLDSLPPGPRSAGTWQEVEKNLKSLRDEWER